MWNNDINYSYAHKTLQIGIKMTFEENEEYVLDCFFCKNKFEVINYTSKHICYMTCCYDCFPELSKCTTCKKTNGICQATFETTDNIITIEMIQCYDCYLQEIKCEKCVFDKNYCAKCYINEHMIHHINNYTNKIVSCKNNGINECSTITIFNDNWLDNFKFPFDEESK